jgi:hypothetical protein
MTAGSFDAARRRQSAAPSLVVYSRRIETAFSLPTPKNYSNALRMMEEE